MAVLDALSPVFPAANGAQMLQGYVPKKYSNTILRKFYGTCVLADISCTDYIGEIKDMGDTVIIRTTPDIEIHDYVKGQQVTPDRYETNTVSVSIDKGKTWAFVTDDVDIKETDLKGWVNNWTTDAAKRLDIAVDEEALAYAVTQAAAANSGGSAGKSSGSFNLGSTTAALALTKSNFVDTVTDCATVLAEQDLPTDKEPGNFWMVLPPWAIGAGAKSDLRQADITGAGRSLTLAGGQGALPKWQLDCFNIYQSSLLPTGTDSSSHKYTECPFGYKTALCFAAQIKTNETVRSANSFGWVHRGLLVYGYKVVDTKQLGVLRIYKG